MLSSFSQALKRKLARTMFDMNIKMFLRDNFVHGGPSSAKPFLSRLDLCGVHS